MKIDDLILFSRQMYSLLKAGVPITRALYGLAETTRNPRMAEIVRDLARDLESGRTLSSSLAQHDEVFSSLFISMINVGENTGQLDLAFAQLSTYLESEKETRNRIKQAMRYPSIVVGAIAIAIAVINLKVIPEFSKMFARFGSELPLPTRILITTSDFFVNYWWLMLIVLVGGAIGLRRYIRTERGRYQWDRFKLRIPIVGGIINRSTLARFARSFAMASKAGVPLLQNLGSVSQAVDNAYVGHHVEEMRGGIERGDSLTRTAAATGLFTPLVIQMMSVGEETGAIDDLMIEVADYYEREVDYDLKYLGDAIEPILIVSVGILVLILALGIFLPMWELGAAAKGR